MKATRSEITRSEIEEIRRYNAAELRCLVKVMDKVRAAINDLGLTINRWDGAGAIAASMLKANDVKKYKGESPPEVFDAARRAYSGGHIEVCKLGYHKGRVHHYDVNSAYPDQFRRLPDLSNGRWKHHSGSADYGFTIVHVEWSFSLGAPFYPLFFRSSGGSIIYPSRGRGWYWFPEFLAAKMYHDRFGGRLEIIESYTFKSATNSRPFGWVDAYYSQRQAYISDAKARGVTSGPEKIIKLGLNSLYGKTAQQVGARYSGEGELILPPYFQLEWAGYVTAGCRAKLMEAAIQKPEAIIGFATDGLFSLEPLNLDCPEEKILGAWEYQVHDGITMVMPGVYWLHDGEKVTNYSRGFDKREMSGAQFVHDAWKKKLTAVPVSITRFVGIGSACASPVFWKMRASFVTSTRSLCLDGDNSKRYPITLHKARPHLGLVNTVPRGALMEGDDLESAPYPVRWLDAGRDAELDDPDGEWMTAREIDDADLS